MNKIIYAIKVGGLSYSGLQVLNIKIGQTTNIESTLRQYKRSNPEVEILDLWEINPLKNFRECEQGIHKIAEKYAYKRERENFIFLQKTYQEFVENANLLLKNITDKIFRQSKFKRKECKRIGSTGRKPKLIRFRGKEYKVNTWREVLCKIAEEIYKDKKDFAPALKIRGKKRVYFSRNSAELFNSLKIENTPYFCECNLSANHIVKIVQNLLDVFGYNQQDLEIIYK